MPRPTSRRPSREVSKQQESGHPEQQENGDPEPRTRLLPLVPVPPTVRDATAQDVDDKGESDWESAKGRKQRPMGRIISEGGMLPRNLLGLSAPTKSWQKLKVPRSSPKLAPMATPQGSALSVVRQRTSQGVLPGGDTPAPQQGVSSSGILPGHKRPAHPDLPTLPRASRLPSQELVTLASPAAAPVSPACSAPACCGPDKLQPAATALPAHAEADAVATATAPVDDSLSVPPSDDLATLSEQFWLGVAAVFK